MIYKYLFIDDANSKIIYIQKILLNQSKVLENLKQFHSINQKNDTTLVFSFSFHPILLFKVEENSKFKQLQSKVYSLDFN